MQSPSSPSSASDPLPILTHTLLAFLISFPLCLILVTHSYLSLLPWVFFPHKLFSFTLLSSCFCISSVSLPFALYCSCQEMRKALNYCAHWIINVKVVVCLLANRQQLTDRVPSSKSSVSQQDRHGLMWGLLITKPWMEIMADIMIRQY